MKQNFLSSFKKELENSFGRKVISSRDCNQMVEDIYQKTGETVNANTLRRFFGLVKADYPPSSSTLTILSRYCGFNSLEEIEHLSLSNVTDTNINKEEVLRYMVSLFKNTQVAGNQEKTFYPLVEQSIIFLERNPSLIDRFQREIAKTATGQYYYYEKLANIDRLNGYYGDGLRHYLREKNTDEGKAFAHAIQVFRYWLTKNKEQLTGHMSEITAIIPAPNFPDHILGRLIAAKLYHAHIKGETIDNILGEAKRYHAGIIARREDSPFSFPDFELIICEALLLTGNYDEGSEYIWHGKTFLSTSGQDKNTLFNLWEDFANRRRDNKNRSFKNTSNTTVFYNSFSKKYSSIIKLLSTGTLKSKNLARNEQLNELVKETGYKRLLLLPV
ncbi:MAG TPA: hypothetical protein VIZ28_04005 [Chitinophagaceae bacterium]